jgi:hypothetical protein
MPGALHSRAGKYMILTMKSCARCGQELDPGSEVFRTTACAACGAELRTCQNCHFYQPGAHWDCRETISEPVRDKSKANFCDWFRFRDASQTRPAGKAAGDAKADFNKLFGN